MKRLGMRKAGTTVQPQGTVARLRRGPGAPTAVALQAEVGVVTREARWGLARVLGSVARRRRRSGRGKESACCLCRARSLHSPYPCTI